VIASSSTRETFNSRSTVIASSEDENFLTVQIAMAKGIRNDWEAVQKRGLEIDALSKLECERAERLTLN
jgi:hypothetical protein